MEKNDDWFNDKINNIKKQKRSLRKIKEPEIVKKIKKDLKREQRSAKRSNKQFVKKFIKGEIDGTNSLE
jgi:hypothetical protein